ncbi:methylated-DNA--[protein]-cysteine S-methyltransferase [Neobacillus massiliamazoniensis]|uniref:Methylated-DNA--protein-cysteine methyltransferase n=1 Tax=Neobacillus massiliamazoniensis TaxID=1499688 RepID=A0A0U1NWH2_9BACI|nr:methylated-DNA--[protein]-cysteine S-methyltransferase [Neobacillus massiliamazoniensis]CRK82371.1 O6-methylguanine-DNA methyltransferase [Neobacillus massiliamazoniensis]
MEFEIIYWSLLEHEGWNLYLAATAKGLCFVGSQNQPFEELSLWAEKHFPGSTLIQNNEKLQLYVEELMEYFQGKRRTFTIPSDYHGTAFQVAVWKALCEIPYGETKSYSDIANHIQKPAAVRAVGTAIGANPVLITVPCHRVIGKNGKLTGFRGGLEMKKRLLELERESMSVTT